MYTPYYRSHQQGLEASASGLTAETQQELEPRAPWTRVPRTGHRVLSLPKLGCSLLAGGGRSQHSSLGLLRKGQMMIGLAQPGAAHTETGEGRDQLRALPGPPTASRALREVINHLRHSGCVRCVTQAGTEELLGRLLHTHGAPASPQAETESPRCQAPRKAAGCPGWPRTKAILVPEASRGWSPVLSPHWEKHQPATRDGGCHTGFPTQGSSPRLHTGTSAPPLPRRVTLNTFGYTF